MTGKLYPSASLEERIQGCLIGVAVGDALGAPFEYLPPGNHHPNLPDSRGASWPITNFHPLGSYPKGSWTDDTGMTLAACRGLIDHARSKRTIEKCLRKSFKVWAGSDECRCPGHTVYHASKYGVPDLNSWASGALMRTAPVAIFAHLSGYDLPQAAKLALEVAELTHGHQLATFPVVEMVLALMSIFSGQKRVPEHILRLGKFLRVSSDNQEQSNPFWEYQKVRQLPLDDIPKATGLFMWKQVFEKVLGVEGGRLWNTLPSFERGILRAVNESFDRDTAGAVAGAILGAYWGAEGIPERWRGQVEKADIIRGLANKIIEACKTPGETMTGTDAATANNSFSLPGQPELEAFLNEQIIDIIQNEEAYQSMGIDFPSPFVLHGPPGCGKTYAVEALVEHLGWPCYYINSQSIGSIYIHEASMKVGKIFETAIQKAPSVVVIDEMESFLGNRQGSQDFRVEEANEFLRQIQSASEKRVLVVGMTNLIERVDPAFLRKGRFDHQIQIAYPSPRAVRAALEKLLADKPCVEGFSLEAATHELTGRPLSDAAFIVREASRLAVRMGKDEIDDICLAQSLRALTRKV